MRITVPLVLVLAVGLSPLPAQSLQTQAAPPPGDKTATIRSTAREVLLDFVVRDKRERLVPDLKAGDIEIYEDGVKQTPRSFKAVTGREAIESEERAKATAAADGRPVPLNPLREINLVSIIFSAMGPRSRELARDAVLSFLKNQMSPNTFGAIYSLDYKLNALQVYTTDIGELKRAVNRAAIGAYSQYGKDNENVLNQVQQWLTGGPSGPALGKAFDPMTSPGMATSPSDFAYGEAAQFQAKALNDQRFLSADSEGLRTLLSLQTFVQRQGMLPGRKTVLYLAEGLTVPPERPELLQDLIAHSNTTNVSFYAIDVRGLATSSATSAAAAMLRNRAAFSGPASRGTENVAVDLGSGSQTATSHVDDGLLLALHAQDQLTMRELAEGTGGFLVANTNEIVKPMRRVMEDVRTHYEIAYAPTSSNYDGRFRKVEVRVHRPGVKVQSRSGYFALPELNGEPVQTYELAGMRVLDAKPAPTAVAFSASLMDFGRVGDSVQCVVAFVAPKSGLATTEDKGRKLTRLRASLFALLKDDKGQIVGKAGKDISISAPADNAQTLNEGDLLYSQPLELRPGHYTLETAIIDREGDKAGVRRYALEVPKPEAPGISTITVVRRIDQRRGGLDMFNPLEFTGGRIVPSLNQRIDAGSDAGFFFVVYPILTADGKPDMTLQPELSVSFYLDGKQISDANQALPMAGDAAAVPVLLSKKLDPGNYMMKVIVRAGARRVERSTAFQVF